MSIFDIFKKKNVVVPTYETQPEHQAKLTLEERIEIFKKNNSETIENLEKKKLEQTIFNVGDVVKLNVVGSPEMTVTKFDLFDFSFWEDIDIIFCFKPPTVDNVMIHLCTHESELTLEYFDNNNVKQTIQTTPNKVTKVNKTLDMNEEILKHINQKYVCPDCGGELIDNKVCFTSFPPKYEYVCSKCLRTVILTK